MVEKMMELSFESLLKDTTGRVIFRGIWGSHAYGTSTPESDWDTFGVYVLEAERYLSFQEPPLQLADARNDNRFYSLRNFLELAANANPNILDAIFLPQDCVLHTSPYWATIYEHRGLFLSRKFYQTYVHYAMGQIRKAHGHKKLIHNPQPERPPTPEDFCYVLGTSPAGMPMRSIPLKESGISLAHCHVSALENSGEIYRLYHYGPSAKGVFHKEMLLCENIPKEDETTHFCGLMLFNKNAYEQAKIKHRQYWEWRRKRNEARWRSQEAGLLNYDAKNLMHTFRLLYSALHLLENGEPLVRFTGEKRQELCDIRAGRFGYEELVTKAETLAARLAQEGEKSSLPESCDLDRVNDLLLTITHQWEKDHAQ